MNTRATDGTERFPTTGPDAPPIDEIELVTTDDDTVLVYDPENAERWIETDEVCSLADWR